VRLITADGRKYMQTKPDGTYDLIFLDVMDGDWRVPNCLSTVEFFRNLRSKLAPGGRLAFDTIDSIETRSSLLSAVAEAFPGQTLQIATTPGLTNTAIIAEAPGGKGWNSSEYLNSKHLHAWRSGDKWHSLSIDSAHYDATDCPSWTGHI